VADIISEISAASQEQSSGVEQVNKAVLQLDETTQQNAALVEESAAAGQGLAAQAKNLLRLMGAFRTEHGKVAAMVAIQEEDAEPAEAPAPKPASSAFRKPVTGATGRLAAAKTGAPHAGKARDPHQGNGHARKPVGVGAKLEKFEEF
jgi:hypothetical protein